MASLRELVTTLKYEVQEGGLAKYRKGFQQIQQQARASGDKVRASMGNVAAATGKTTAAARQHTGELAKQQSIGNGVANTYGRMRTAVAGIVSVWGAVSAAKMSDEWASTNSRIELATNGAEEFKYAQEQAFQIAQRSRQEYTATGDLFQKVNRNAKDLNLTLDDSLKLTETIGKAMTIGGGDTGAQQAALMQLGQAMASGSLRGDELNSILEQSPRLALAIADGFGVSVGELRKLGAAGKLTSKDLASGLLKQSEKIGKEFERMPVTFGQTMTYGKNELLKLVGKFNEATGASKAFNVVMVGLFKNIKVVGMALGAAFGAKLLVDLRGAGAAIGLLRTRLLTMGSAAWASLGPYALIAAAIFAVGLIVEDVVTWLNGGESALGALVGRSEEWQSYIDAIAQPLGEIWSAIKEIGGVIGEAVVGIANFMAGILGLNVSFSSVQEVAKAVFRAILTTVAQVFSFIANIVKMWAAIFRGDFSAAAGFAKQALGIVAGVFGWLHGVVASIMNAIGAFIANKWSQVVAWTISKWQSIVAYLGGLVGTFVSIGSNIISGIWSGLRSGWDAMYGWFSAKIASLAESAKSLLGIHSPSRVFSKIGGFITEGLGIGIVKDAPTAVSGLQGVIGQLMGVGNGANIGAVMGGFAMPTGGFLGGMTAQGGASSNTFNITVNAGSGDAQAIAKTTTGAIQRVFNTRAVPNYEA